MTDQIAALGVDIEARNLEADVCVIGSGPAGGIVAAELAARGRDVLLLEAGSFDPSEPDGAGLGVVDVDGDTDLQFARARQVGGSSNLWAGRVAPLEPIDFETRPWAPGMGWPIQFSDLERYYVRARQLMGFEGAMTALAPPDPLTGMVQGGELDIKSFEWSRPPFKIADYLEAALKRSPTLRLLSRAPVTELVEEEDGAIGAAVVLAPDGRRIEVRARRFVLAAGGIETPRLLLASRNRRPAGVGNDHDVVGRYFSTHPKADMAALVLARRTGLDHALFADRRGANGMTMRGGLGFSADAQRRHQLLNHYVQLSPFFEYRASRAFEMMKGSKALTSPLIQNAAFTRGALASLGLAAFEAVGRIGRLQPRAKVFILRAFLDQLPNPENRIQLSAETDRFGLPKADMRWRFTDEDRRSVLRFFDLLDERVRAHGVGRIEYRGLVEAGEWPMTAVHSHFMGTARMGNDPRSSVVDRNCRVHGSPNLYLSGPAVFPSYGYANPFLTIAALSFRLADHLA